MNITCIAKILKTEHIKFDSEFKTNNIHQSLAKKNALTTTLDRKNAIAQGKNKIKNKWQ
nr:hypothetical protein [uncultured Cellulosilyticum sp.]